MGLLQESKSRKRINNDPNNTKWTRDETTFGQRILRSQGWQPGQFLGAQDAPHSELHTSANASYIRVVLKDDMKGLGFNKAKEDEITGLDVFSDLLSRLNGKSEESIESDKQARLAVKTNIWVERKYGPMRFVRGGLLVGDKIEEEDSSSSSSEEEEKKEETVAETKSDKKRKATAMDDDSKAAKKSKKQKKQSSTDEDESDEDKPKKSKSKKDKKEKKDKKKKKKKSKSKESDGSASEVSEDEAKRLKKARKEEKRIKKEKKEKKNKESSSATDTPADSGASTPRNRNFVRSRFIAQKRQAVLDTKALNQIFMLKT